MSLPNKRRGNRPAGKNYKKYIGNKNEGHGFVNKQRERVSFQYKKLKRKEDRKQEYLARQNQKLPRTEVERFSDFNQNSSHQRNKNFQDKKKHGKHVFQKLQEEADKKKKEAQMKKEELLLKQKEREEALQKYKDRRRENYRKLSKKTKTGQPMMKYQIGFLLDKIEKSIKKT